MQRSEHDIIVIIGLSLSRTAIGIIHYSRQLYDTFSCRYCGVLMYVLLNGTRTSRSQSVSVPRLVYVSL